MQSQKVLPMVKDCICVIMPVRWSISAGACGIPVWQLSQSHTSNYRHTRVPSEKWLFKNSFFPGYTFKFCEWIAVDKKKIGQSNVKLEKVLRCIFKVMVYSTAGRQTSLPDLFLSHSPLQCCGMVRSCSSLVISKFFSKECNCTCQEKQISQSRILLKASVTVWGKRQDLALSWALEPYGQRKGSVHFCFLPPSTQKDGE